MRLERQTNTEIGETTNIIIGEIKDLNPFVLHGVNTDLILEHCQEQTLITEYASSITSVI